jgi:transcriptional regulator with AAA-type ATPase domain
MKAWVHDLLARRIYKKGGTLGLLKPEDQAYLETVARINYANPFLPERIKLERDALGADFDESRGNWNLLGDAPEFLQINTAKIMEKAYLIITQFNKKLREGGQPTSRELELYEDTGLFLLYHVYVQKFKEDILNPQSGQQYKYFSEFKRYWEMLFDINGHDFPQRHEAAHVFACFFQVRRAFYYIFRAIIGRSSVAANLRADVWNSIFTHDMRRYRRSYFKHMHDFTSLIVGPTGSGKELVARAIGYSRYIPFNAKTMTFETDFFEIFLPINLSAMPSTLVESELFGHRRGAFTGALEDRKGWLEACTPEGTVFLDEIGELDPLIQVKLLRVIQDRTFQPLGSTQTKSFEGKIVAATHRDIHNAMEQGKFRKDFYYRLCSDIITTPSLQQQIVETPDVLWDLVGYIAKRVAGDEADELAAEVQSWIRDHLGLDYSWPGNIRELEQCVRNVMIRREYHPAIELSLALDDNFAASFQKGSFSMEELLRIYCTRIYKQTGSYVETARRLKIDRRTVKKYVGSEKYQ